MTAQARFRQADVERALKAAKRCGFSEVRVIVGLDGRIEIAVGKASNDQGPEELE